MFSRPQSLHNFQNFTFRRSEAKPCFAFILLFGALILFVPPNAAAQNTGKLRRQAEKALRQGEFAAAAQNYQELVQAEPSNMGYRLGLSYAFYKNRLWEDSHEQANLILKAEPGNPHATAILGSIYLAAGRFEIAARFFDAALFTLPDEALALAGSAMLDFYENRSKQGLVKLRRAVYLKDEEPDFYFALAQVASRTENYKEAANAYLKFLEVSPKTDTERRERIQGLATFLRYLGNVKSLYSPEGKSATTIECEIVNNRPVVKVRVNGNPEPLRFVLDTGSGMTVISEKTAERLGINSVVRGGVARAIGGEGKFEIVYGFLDMLEIGEVRVARIPVYIRQFNGDGDQFDGYIGLSVIAKFITTLDYGKTTFSLVKNIDKAAKKDKSTKAKIPVAAITMDGENLSVPLRTTSSGFLSSQVKIEGVNEPLNFILDTGASVSVLSSEAAQLEGISNRFAHTTLLKIYGAAGVAENVSTLMLPRLTLGATSREKVMAAILDLNVINETTGYQQAGIIGGNFLRHYRLTFDFQKSNVTFEPSN